jgi:hypothetical protein
VLALVSIALITWDAFTWRGLELWHLEVVPKTIWSRLGAPPYAGLALVCATAALTVAAGGRELLRGRPWRR